MKAVIGYIWYYDDFSGVNSRYYFQIFYVLYQSKQPTLFELYIKIYYDWEFLPRKLRRLSASSMGGFLYKVATTKLTSTTMTTTRQMQFIAPCVDLFLRSSGAVWILKYNALMKHSPLLISYRRNCNGWFVFIYFSFIDCINNGACNWSKCRF